MTVSARFGWTWRFAARPADAASDAALSVVVDTTLPSPSAGDGFSVSAEDVRLVAGADRVVVENKIAAIDETWSGLRFLRRLTDR
jgi:hypothetical protein